METATIEKVKIRIVNPSTGKTEKTIDTMSERQLDKVLNNATKAFEKWKMTSFEERAALLRRVSKLFTQKKKALAILAAEEMGKRFEEGIDEVNVCIGILNYYAKNSKKFLADKKIETERGKAFIAYEPMGVILSVQPWNFPYYQVIRNTAPNLMCGNTVVLKHAEIVTGCAKMIEDIFKEAGAPDGIFTNVYLRGPETTELSKDDRIKGVMFTGSGRAGASLATAAGENVKKILLELGGSDAIIILDDADLDKALMSAVMERLSNCGQVCTSPKRIIVMSSIAKEFTQKAKAMYEKIRIGEPLDKKTQLGPLSSEKQLNTVLKQVQDTVRAGAKLVYGGNRLDREGFYMEPTILTGIKRGMVAYSEEIFGPVLCIYTVKDEAEAICLANDNIHGLGGSVFSRNNKRAIEVARQMVTGMVCINDIVTSTAELPFGGTKKSGYGRELSELGIHEFVNPKLIHIP